MGVVDVDGPASLGVDIRCVDNREAPGLNLLTSDGLRFRSVPAFNLQHPTGHLQIPLSVMKRSATSPEPTPSKRAKKSTLRSVKTNDVEPESTRHRFLDVSPEYLTNSSREWKIFSDDELPGAQVFYLAEFLDEATANELLGELEQLETCACLCSRSAEDIAHVFRFQF